MDSKNKDLYLDELIEINNILERDYLSYYDRMSKVLLYEFKKYRQVGKNYFSLTEYFDIICNADIPPKQSEIRKTEKLIECLVFLSKNLITNAGIEELYPELTNLELHKLILWNPDANSDVRDIFNSAPSSDILTLRKKLKKGVYGNYKRFMEYLHSNNSLSYANYKVEKERFLSVYGKEKSKKYLGRLFDFERNFKFKIDSYTYNKIKTLRRHNIISMDGIDTFDLIDLKENIAPVYWSRIPKILWNGIKGEYTKIRRIKNEHIKNIRKSVFIFRYNKYSDRINNLKSWH